MIFLSFYLSIYLILFYSILSYALLCYAMLFYSVLSYPILSYLSIPVVPCLLLLFRGLRCQWPERRSWFLCSLT
jgi:hypothetical protein